MTTKLVGLNVEARTAIAEALALDPEITNSVVIRIDAADIATMRVTQFLTEDAAERLCKTLARYSYTVKQEGQDNPDCYPVESLRCRESQWDIEHDTDGWLTATHSNGTVIRAPLGAIMAMAEWAEKRQRP